MMHTRSVVIVTTDNNQYNYRVGQIKLGQCSFFRRSKACFKKLIFFAGEITVHLRTLRSINIKYFSPDGATIATDFLCSSIHAVLLTHNFCIQTILLTNNFCVKKSSAFASIYLLASVMYCNLLEGNSYLFLLK